MIVILKSFHPIRRLGHTKYHHVNARFFPKHFYGLSLNGEYDFLARYAVRLFTKVAQVSRTVAVVGDTGENDTNGPVTKTQSKIVGLLAKPFNK